MPIVPFSSNDPCATVNSLVSLFHGQAGPSFFDNGTYVSNLPSLSNFYTSRSGLNFLGCSLCNSQDKLISSCPNSYCGSNVLYNLPTSMLDFIWKVCLWSVKRSSESMSKRGMSHPASTLNLMLSIV